MSRVSQMRHWRANRVREAFSFFGSDLEPRHGPIQRRAANTQQSCRGCSVRVDSIERLKNACPLFRVSFSGVKGGQTEDFGRQIGWHNHRSIRVDDGRLNRALQFADVSRPLIFHQDLQGLTADFRYRQPLGLRICPRNQATSKGTSSRRSRNGGIRMLVTRTR